MVLLTKQDFDDLRSHALPNSSELPRPLPMSGNTGNTNVGSTPAQGANMGGSAGSAQPRWTGPKVERRVRSAGGRRPPHMPNGAYLSQLVGQSQSVDVDSRRRVEPGAAVVEAGAVRRQSNSDRSRGGDVPRPERLRKDASVVQRAERGLPRQQSPTPRLQVLPNAAPALGLHGGPLPGGPAIGRSASTRARSEGSKGPSWTTSCPPTLGGAPSAGTGVCGYGDPRNVSRPADQVLRAVEMGFPVGVGPGVVPLKSTNVRDNSVANGLQVNSLQTWLLNGGPNGLQLGLQVSGLAAPVCSGLGEAEATDIDLEIIGWSSSEDEEENLHAGGKAKSPCSQFAYREFRYLRCQQARVRAAPPEPRQRGARQRRSAAPSSSHVRDDSAGSGCSSPWGLNTSPTRRLDSAVPAASSRMASPCREEEHLDEELRQELHQVGDALVKFYALPGGMRHALRLKGNLIAVLDEAWAQKHRESRLTEPPTMWVRGGRVYDFHGDRGTVAEFLNDFLVRQVEDDAICRQRRREQGLLPYPFVAAPLKRDPDGEEPEADAPANVGFYGGVVSGVRNADARKRPLAPFR